MYNITSKYSKFKNGNKLLNREKSSCWPPRSHRVHHQWCCAALQRTTHHTIVVLSRTGSQLRMRSDLENGAVWIHSAVFLLRGPDKSEWSWYFFEINGVVQPEDWSVSCVFADMPVKIPFELPPVFMKFHNIFNTKNNQGARERVTTETVVLELIKGAGEGRVLWGMVETARSLGLTNPFF